MIDLKVDISRTSEILKMSEIENLQEDINRCRSLLFEKTGEGNDFLGWIDLPDTITEELISDIDNTAKVIAEKAEIFVVIGIGGSYLGARAVIEALGHNFYEFSENKKVPFVVYAGHNIGEDYLTDLLEILDIKDYALTVISKSGTTTEPAIAFRILKNHLENKYGKKEAGKRIIAITDKEKGALKQLANNEGYKTYVVPDDVGGRYSVLTPVGLLPIAVAGFNIREIINGAKKMQDFNEQTASIFDNPINLYAAARNVIYFKGKPVEILANYLPNLYYMTEWWKQLYGESEGKNHKGIFPAGVNFTTDLHSMGQYIQDGLRIIFETVISVENPNKNLLIPEDADNLDKLNYLAGKKIHEVNKKAELGTMIAHVDGGVPNIKITIPTINENTIGQLIYFFEFACAVSGYLLKVNPFDQPGVEDYKRNMFALLGKPGFEAETAKINKRL